MKKNALFYIVCFLWGTAAFAAPGSGSGVEFLKLGAGARPLAMGNAFTAQPGDLSAIFFNPAGLSQLILPEAMTLYGQSFGSTAYQAAAVAYPTNIGTVGLGYLSFGSGDIQGYDQNGALTSSFNTYSYGFNLSLARKLNTDLSIGGGVRLISERLEGSAATTLALDAGLLYKANSVLNLGLAVINYGPGLKFISDTTPLPTAYRLATGWTIPFYNAPLKVNTDIVFYPDTTRFNVGAEYLVKNLLAVRLGSDGGLPRAGIGLAADRFSFDYAYLSHQELGGAHQFSLGILLDSPAKIKTATSPYYELLSAGKKSYDKGEYLDALVLFSRVLEMNPDNSDALALQKEAQNKLERQLTEKGRADSLIYLGEAMKSVVNRQYKTALEQVKRALAKDPDNEQAQNLKKKLEFILSLDKKN